VAQGKPVKSDVAGSVDERLLGVRRIRRACQQGDVAALAAYVEHGYSMDWVDENGENALMVAAEYGHEACVAYLLPRTGDLDALSKQDMSAAMLAACKGRSDCLKLIVDSGCRLDASMEEGWTALIWAAMNNARCVKILLAAGCEVDAVCREGKSAAMYAANSGLLESLKALVEAGADVERLDVNGVSAMELALRRPDSGCVPYLAVELERAALARHVGDDGSAKAKPLRM
jgi:ankyrin repeat protein